MQVLARRHLVPVRHHLNRAPQPDDVSVGACTIGRSWPLLPKVGLLTADIRRRFRVARRVETSVFDNFERVAEAKGRKYLHCNVCKRRTIHSLEARCKGSWTEEPVSGGAEYSIYRCGACDTVCYETSSWDSESYDHDEDGELYCPTYEIQWPPPSSAKFTFNTEYTPSQLDELIDEMMYAFAGAKLNLATVGLRMVIEFIVKDKACPGSNLLKKIDALHADGHIDERQKELLHKIRKRGNAGAHDASPMNSNELVAGMGVVELLLEKFYNGPGRHSLLLKRAEAVLREPDAD
jgi:hypothetical protein